MKTVFVVAVAALAGAVPAAAQQAVRTAGHFAATPVLPGRLAVVQQLTGMSLVLALRAQGAEDLRAGRTAAAIEKFTAALRVLDSLPEPRASHATIGFFPHFLLFMPPLNY